MNSENKVSRRDLLNSYWFKSKKWIAFTSIAALSSTGPLINALSEKKLGKANTEDVLKNAGYNIVATAFAAGGMAAITDNKGERPVISRRQLGERVVKGITAGVVYGAGADGLITGWEKSH